VHVLGREIAFIADSRAEAAAWIEELRDAARRGIGGRSASLDDSLRGVDGERRSCMY